MQIGGLTERGASHYLLATFFAFFVGKLVATLVMKRVGPAKVLIVYGILCIALLAYTISVHDITAVYAAVGVACSSARAGRRSAPARDVLRLLRRQAGRHARDEACRPGQRC